MSDWRQLPHIKEHPQVQHWLEIQSRLGLADNTLQAYARAMNDYLRICELHSIDALAATKEHVALFVQDMRTRERGDGLRGLANATIHQRLTGIRLFYDYLIEEGVRERNPVGGGHHNPGRVDRNQRGIIPRERRLPWIPTHEQWRAILQVARTETVRNRTMLALAYDAALRREELCQLKTNDIDPSQRLIHIRAEITKNRQARVVPYSTATGMLYQAYLSERRRISRSRGPLFLSESPRNQAQPISIWTWSKVVHSIAQRADVPKLTTHTFRHLCLTDLACAGWDIHEIARFAGHRSIQSTLTYIHLSGHDLALKFANGMAELHDWRICEMAEVWS